MEDLLLILINWCAAVSGEIITEVSSKPVHFNKHNVVWPALYDGITVFFVYESHPCCMIKCMIVYCRALHLMIAPLNLV